MPVLSIFLKPPLDAFFDRVVVLEPLSIVHTNALIHSRVGSILTEEAMNEIYRISQGNPRITLMLCRNILLKMSSEGSTLKEALSYSLRDYQLEERYLERRHPKGAMSIDTSQKKVLEFLRIHGATSASELKLQKYAVVGRTRLVQILNELCQEGLLNKIIKGRKALYSIREVKSK